MPQGLVLLTLLKYFVPIIEVWWDPQSISKQFKVSAILNLNVELFGREVTVPLVVETKLCKTPSLESLSLIVIIDTDTLF